MNYRDYTLGDWIGHISGVIADEGELDGNEMRDLLDFLTKLPKWIPVSEGLPEETKANYWVCTDSGYQCQCRWTNNLFGLREGNTWAWSIFDIPQYSKVKAWMPLPEPYKAEREEEE